MEEGKDMSSSHLFLVRLWLEGGDAERSPWKFRVQHVNTGKTGTSDGETSLMDLLVSMVPHSNPTLAPPKPEYNSDHVRESGQSGS